MKNRSFDIHLVSEFLAKFKSAKKARERRSIIRWFCQITGASESTARRLAKNNGRGVKDTSRKHKFATKEYQTYAQRLAAIKRLPGEHAKPIPTSIALKIARSFNLVPDVSLATADRLLAFHGLNQKAYTTRPAGTRLTADYPGHVFVVDATPIDHYYLTLDMRIQRYDAPAGDKHLDDHLSQKGLMKIWVYYLVDMYSHAFLVRPYADLPKTAGAKNAGESADTWLDMLMWAMRPKFSTASPLPDKPNPLAQCPIEGIPTILYCDKGSGIGGSNLVHQVLSRLGVRIVTHMPHNPRAKGIVESRISAFKRRYEPLILREKISDINQLIYFYQSWCHYHNQISGFYEKWACGAITHPLIRLTDQNINDAFVSHTTRRINAQGCIEIDKKLLFVTHDERYINTTCIVFRPPVRNGENARYIVELKDGTIVQDPPDASVLIHSFGEFKRHPKTIGETNREEAKKLSKSIAPYVSYGDLLPAEKSNILRLPQKVAHINTHSPIPTKFTTKEDAIHWILRQCGAFWEELTVQEQESLDSVFTIALKRIGFIPGSTAVELSNILIQEKQRRSNEI